ncbi:MAG: hypothetical protein ABI432_12880 [Flavobacteriales bacterium]
MEPLSPERCTRWLMAAAIVLRGFPAAQAQDPRPTRWDVAGTYMTNYDAHNLMDPTPQDMRSGTTGSAWRVECGYRPGKWGTLVLAYDRAATRHGWNATNELISTTSTPSWFFGTITTNVYEADLLTLAHTMNTLSVLHRIAIRPYAGRHHVGFGLHAAWGLRVHNVAAELGLVANQQYTVSDNILMSATGYEPYGPAIAISNWDARQVVQRATAWGASLAVELRPELYFTRYVSLFADVDLTLPLAEPHFAAHTLEEDALVRPEYRVTLGGVRTGVGLAIHF